MTKGLPYDDVRIVDFTVLEQGPVATQVLADFGADVIKIEPIGNGEIGRQQSPSLDGVSCFWAAFNRNKRSLSLNLKMAEARAIVLKLVEISDVVVSNFRPGVMERLGFGHADLLKVNPRIISAYGSGYGRTGPYRDRRGQDLAAQAMGGLMAMTGHRDGPPTAVGSPVIDYVAALHLAQGIMAALAARARTGEGQEVDACLLNAAVAVHLAEGTSHLNTGLRYPRPHRGDCYAHNGPLYGTYRTRDDKWLVIVGQFTPDPWKHVCAALGIGADIAEDERFQTREGQVAHEAELRGVLEAAFAKLTRGEAAQRLDEQDILWGPVNEHVDVFADPQVVHNGMILEARHPNGGPLRLVGNPVKLAGTPPTLRLSPPLVGQHNEEILSALGYGQAAIQVFRDKAVLGTVPGRARA